jgi:WD40 repeat protein
MLFTRVRRPFALAVLLLAGGCAADPFGDLCNASLDVSPDGRYLAAVSQIGEIRVWDLATGRRALLLPRGGVSKENQFAVRYFGAALRGNTGQLLFDCFSGTLCSF